MSPTRNRIQEAALKLFAEKGYEGVTTKEIARGSEISEVTLFRHFRSKRELFDSISEEKLTKPTLQYLAPLSFTGQWHTDITRYRGLIHQFQEDNRDLFRMLIKDSHRPSGELPQLKEFNTRLSLFLKEYLMMHWELKDPEKAAILAFSLIGALSGLAFNHCIIGMCPGTSYRESADQLIMCFFAYKEELRRL